MAQTSQEPKNFPARPDKTIDWLNKSRDDWKGKTQMTKAELKDIFMLNIQKALADIKQGKFVIVADDFNRENEGDLIMAGEKVTPEAIAFMIRYTSGVICVPMLRKRLEELSLPLMVERNTESMRTAFTISVDYKYGTTTGISAADRGKTILALSNPTTKPEDFNRPGHIFPLRCSEGSILERQGHTEAAVELARMSGLYPAGILAELVNDDGTMKRMNDLEKFAATHKLTLLSVKEILEYRRYLDKTSHLDTASV